MPFLVKPLASSTTIDRGIFSPQPAREGSRETVDRFQVFQSWIERRGHTVFEFSPDEKTSSIPRRALLMGRFAGVSVTLSSDRSCRNINRLADRRRNRRFSVVQIRRPGASLSLSPRSDQQRVPSPPRSRHRRRAQSFQNAEIPGPGGNLQHWVDGIPRCILPVG
jgi:hypothetical protein